MLWLLLVVIVIAVGIVLVIRYGGATATSSGTVQMGDAALNTGSAPTIGMWALVSGLVAGVSVAMIGQASFDWVAAFDLPQWLVIVMFWMIPLGITAAVILGALAIKRDSGRAAAVAGLVLAGLAAAAFFAMQVVAG